MLANCGLVGPYKGCAFMLSYYSNCCYERKRQDERRYERRDERREVIIEPHRHQGQRQSYEMVL